MKGRQQIISKKQCPVSTAQTRFYSLAEDACQGSCYGQKQVAPANQAKDSMCSMQIGIQASGLNTNLDCFEREMSVLLKLLLRLPPARIHCESTAGHYLDTLQANTVMKKHFLLIGVSNLLGQQGHP